MAYVLYGHIHKRRKRKTQLLFHDEAHACLYSSMKTRVLRASVWGKRQRQSETACCYGDAISISFDFSKTPCSKPFSIQTSITVWNPLQFPLIKQTLFPAQQSPALICLFSKGLPAAHLPPLGYQHASIYVPVCTCAPSSFRSCNLAICNLGCTS